MLHVSLNTHLLSFTNTVLVGINVFYMAINIDKILNLIFYCISHLDIDECLDRNGGCSDTCQNTPGSYICTCPFGYTLDVVTRQCIGTYVLHFTLHRKARARNGNDTSLEPEP